MANFSVILTTASPSGLAGETGGAFVKIDGRESLLRSVEMFLNRDNVKQMQLVVTKEHVADAKAKYGANLGFSGVKLVAAGGKWIEQLQEAGKNLSAETTHVLVHDAARPAVPYSDIDAVMTAAEQSERVTLATPVRAGMLELDEGNSPVAAHLPSRFMLMQTPQVFARSAFEQLTQSGQEPHASQWKIVRGSPLNVRVGTASDAGFVKAMLAMLPKPKIRAASSPFEEAQW